MKKNDKTLQDALVAFNVLSRDDTQNYLTDAQSKQISLKDYLLNNKLVTEKQILISLSQSLNLGTVDFRNLTIEPDVIEKIPIKFAWYYQFMPISISGDVLTIACAIPLDVKIQDEIRMHLGFQIKIVLAQDSDLKEAIKKHYGLASDTIERIMAKEPLSEKASSAESGQWIEDLETQTDDPTVSNLVNEIILEAYKKRATDIHIEPYRDKVRFRYRIDGVLVDANLPENVKHFLSPILSRIKILANLSITEKRLPQDGSAVVKTKEQNLDLRISTMPTPRGESMVIRILPTKVMLFSLEKLGFEDKDVQLVRDLIQKPHGIIFMTGPTGSGKTTSLYACLKEINATERKIITIEDPVEYEMEGITQIQVNTKVNFDFTRGLRSVLRHDPDIIMVGEVRDLETTEIAIRTALTGHLVFSTLHTNDAASGITRLIDMGVEPYLVASSVEAFIAQRLVRVICEECKEEDERNLNAIKQEIRQSIDVADGEDIKIYKGSGCEHCNYTGFYGRMAIYEILTLNDTIRSAILEKPRADHIKNVAIRGGLATLRQTGWRVVAKGMTTPEEVMNVTVRDEEVKEGTLDQKDVEEVFSEPTRAKELHRIKIKRRGPWASKDDYEGRIYSRTDERIDLRFRHVEQDPSNPDFFISDGIEFQTVTKDLSAGGMSFVSNDIIPVGTILEVKFQIDDAEAIECLAKVCRIEKDSRKDFFTIVTFFLDISSTDRVTISRFVEENNQDSSQDFESNIST